MVGMSRLTWIRSDVLALACRPSRARRATCPGWDVAPRADPERHARVGMSPFTNSSSDMLALACRPSRGFGATCSPWHVAPHACEVRHGSVCSVSTPLEQGDIHPLACGAARVGRATCRGPMGDGRERLPRPLSPRAGGGRAGPRRRAAPGRRDGLQGEPRRGHEARSLFVMNERVWPRAPVPR
jgi:hypothetical protein